MRANSGGAEPGDATALVEYVVSEVYLPSGGAVALGRSVAEGIRVGDEPQVHRMFDPATGREVLLCHDTATFERLREVLRREAQVGVTIDVPAAPVRSVSVELAEYADPATVGWGARLGAWGCVIGLVAAGVVFVIGLLAIAGVAWR